MEKIPAMCYKACLQAIDIRATRVMSEKPNEPEKGA
jgi:hypothetical protein